MSGEGEERVARQEAIVERMLKSGYKREAAEAIKLLETMQTTLRLAREHLRREEKSQGRTRPDLIQRSINTIFGVLEQCLR